MHFHFLRRESEETRQRDVKELGIDVMQREKERDRERKREEGKAGRERKGRARIPEHTEPLLSQDLTRKGRRPKSPRRIFSNRYRDAKCASDASSDARKRPH